MPDATSGELKAPNSAQYDFDPVDGKSLILPSVIL
jgi:hypothetical protein